MSAFSRSALLGVLSLAGGFSAHAGLAQFDSKASRDKHRLEASRRAARSTKEMLLNLSADREPLMASMQADGRGVRLDNILHEGVLWSVVVDPSELIKAYAYTVPLPGGFHLSAGFFAEGGFTLREMDGDRKAHVSGLVIGTGPTNSMSLGAILGAENISTRAKTYEQYLSDSPKLPNYAHEIDSTKISLPVFFMAYAEEAARLHFLQSLRIVLIDGREGARDPDPFDFGRYTLFNNNCVSSGARNLIIALKPKYHSWVLEMLKNDVSSLDGTMTMTQLSEQIVYWAKVDRSLGRILDELRSHADDPSVFDPPLDLERSANIKKALEAAVSFKRGLGGGTLNIAWPARAKVLLDFVTNKLK